MADSVSSANGGDGDTTTGVSAFIIVLAVVSVALRFWTRIFTKVGLGWDDWLILAALVSAVLTGVLVLWATEVDPDGAWVTSNSDPTYHYTPANILHLKLSFIASILYFTIASSTKLSILLMYNRLFSVSASFRHQVTAVSTLVVGFWVGCTVATLVNCRPLEWSWRNSLSDARYCFNYNIFWMASGAIEAFIDVLIIALPIRVVIGLQLQKRKKVTIAMVFLLGIFVIVTGLVKVILGYVPGSRVPSYTRTEVWTTVHVGMGITCACMPVCWPLIVRLSRLELKPYLRFVSARRWYDSHQWRSVGKSDSEASAQVSADREVMMGTEMNKLPSINIEEERLGLQIGRSFDRDKATNV